MAELADEDIKSPRKFTILKALQEHGPMTSREVAEAVGISPNNASTRLHEYHSQALVGREQAGMPLPVAGPRTLLYSITERGEGRLEWMEEIGYTVERADRIAGERGRERGRPPSGEAGES